MLKGFCYFFRRSRISQTMSSAADVKSFVDIQLKNKKVVVFSKSYCPFCKKAKDALAKFKLTPDVYEVIEIEDRDDCDDIQEYMGSITGGTSVPRVFISGKFIGGGDDTVKLEKNGELKKMLENAGAL